MAASKIQIKKVCEHCNKVFYAYKRTTRFCCTLCSERHYKQSLRIKQQQKVEKETDERIKIIRLGDVSSKEYLSIIQAAELLGISRFTVYRYIHSGMLCAYNVSNKKTFVSRKDISSFLEQHPFNSEQRTERKPDTAAQEYYTTKEIMEKYGVSESWIFKLAKKQCIPKIVTSGKTYWNKKLVDLHFRKSAPNPEIVDWYSVQEVMTLFGFASISSVYSLATLHQFPKKKEGKEVYYSKIHVDKAKGIAPEYDSYYTVEDIKKKYGISRDIIYRQTKNFNVTGLKTGRMVRYPKADIDDLFGSSIK